METDRLTETQCVCVCIAIEKGRHRQTWLSREDRLCAHCPQNYVVTELRFLTSCQIHYHIRDTYFPQITQLHYCYNTVYRDNMTIETSLFFWNFCECNVYCWCFIVYFTFVYYLFHLFWQCKHIFPMTINPLHWIERKRQIYNWERDLIELRELNWERERERESRLGFSKCEPGERWERSRVEGRAREGRSPRAGIKALLIVALE